MTNEEKLIKLKENDFCEESFINKIIEKVLNPLFEGNCPSQLFKIEPDISKEQNELCINLYPKDLYNRYEKMRCHIDDDKKEYFIAYTKANLIFDPNKLNINEEKINGFSNEKLKDENGKIIIGLDLPVLIGKANSKCRVMVISQDPSRPKSNFNKKLLKEESTCALSSPFGWHYIKWRNSKGNGFIPRIFLKMFLKDSNYITNNDKIKNKCLDNVPDFCAYFTDFYKFRKANVDENSKSEIDTRNEAIYELILDEEIKIFEPTHIIFLGKKVSEIFCPGLYNYNGNYEGNWDEKGSNNFYKIKINNEEDKNKNLNIKVMAFPHPSPNNRNLNQIGNYSEKEEKYIEEIIKFLNK
jgi:uracil-DNA glycosylase